MLYALRGGLAQAGFIGRDGTWEVAVGFDWDGQGLVVMHLSFVSDVIIVTAATGANQAGCRQSEDRGNDAFHGDVLHFQLVEEK